MRNFVGIILGVPIALIILLFAFFFIQELSILLAEDVGIVTSRPEDEAAAADESPAHFRPKLPECRRPDMI